MIIPVLRTGEFTKSQNLIGRRDWLKNGELFLRNAIVICEMSKTFWQMGKLRMKGDSENHSEDQEFLLVALVEYHSISVRDQSRHPQFGKNVLPGIFLGYALIAGRIWKRRHFDCGFGRVGKDARIGDPSSKNQCKGSVDATKGRTFHFPSCRWYSKTVRKRPRSARTHSKAGPQNQKMTLKLGETSGRFTVTSSVVIIWNLEFNSVRHKKKHSLFH